MIPVGGIGTVAVVMGGARLGTFGLLSEYNAHLEIPAKLELMQQTYGTLICCSLPAQELGTGWLLRTCLLQLPGRSLGDSSFYLAS